MESPFFSLALIDHFPFSVPIPVVHNFQPRYWYMDITVGKAMPLLFNKLSRLVITFLPRSNHLLISWLQLPSAVMDFGAPQNKICHCFHFFPSIGHEVMEPDAMILLSFKPLFQSPLGPSSRGSLVPLHFLPSEWYHLYIWGCWYFFWQSYQGGPTLKELEINQYHDPLPKQCGDLCVSLAGLRAQMLGQTSVWILLWR